MRLTLRTLLAYLDDSLEPAQAKEIGEKIAESSVASELATRIRETLRRRRITAPQISGPGSGPDPNLTAEYLDLTMTPEDVAEFEQFCLESDVHLAEVTACHQILTLVLGERADVSSELRMRMHELGAVAPLDSATSGVGETQATVAATGDQTGVASAAAPLSSRAASFEDGLPQQLRRKSFVSRAIPAAIALICIAWLALVYLDPHLWDRDSVPEDLGPALAGTVVEEDESNDSGEPSAPRAESPAEQPATEQPAPVEPEAEATDQGEPVVPAGGTAIDPETTDADNTTEPMPPESTVPDVTPQTPTTVPQPDPDTIQQPAEPEPPVNMVLTLYNSPEGILLQRHRETGDWTVLPRRALLHAGDEIACPNPFTARLQIDEGAFLITIMGGARVRLIGANAGGPFGFELIRGRVGAFRMPSEQPGEPPIGFGMQMRDQLYSVELMVPNTWCGFDFVPAQPHGRARAGEPGWIGGGIFVARGAVKIEDPVAGASQLTPENGWWSWAADDGGAQPLLAVPNWLSPDGATLPPSYRRYVTLYSKEFPLDQPVRLSIPAIVRDRRPMLSKLSVETLALTGNYRELVRALSAEHEESRLAAIVGLREWLLGDERHAELLAGELTMSFRDDAAEAVEELIWGYSIDDGRDAATSARLVDWLGNDEVAIRELALFHIEILTGRDNDFHPTASVAQRDAAVARWHDFLRRNGSLVPTE